MAIVQQSHWTDDPIGTSNEDAFGRVPYAVRAANLIVNSHSWESSIVFGLTGPWGSGKSSLIELLVESLGVRHDNWRIVRFTPWATSDAAGLLREFYACLSSVLPKDRFNAFKKTVSTLAQITAPAAKVVPVVGEALAEGLNKAADVLMEQPPWDEVFKNASEQLRELATPVLIIADDIDRLQGDELLALLKVVRLLGRFPGVQYLLAYDEQTVFKTIESANLVDVKDGSAHRFMEKIVQYPLAVPPMLPHQVAYRLDYGIRAVLEDIGPRDLDLDRLTDAGAIMQRLLLTPRAIDRYIAQLRHHLPMIDTSEIDDADVLLLALLRVSFPSVYALLPSNRSALIQGHTDKLLSLANGLEYQQFDIAILLRDVPEQRRAEAQELLCILFPKVREQEGVSVQTPHVGRRICTDEYFDRYFAMGILENDIPNSLIRRAVDGAAGGDGSELHALLTNKDIDKRRLAIAKGASIVDTVSTNAGRLALVAELCRSVEDQPNEIELIVNTKRQVVEWIASILGKLVDPLEPGAILDSMAATSPGTVFWIIRRTERSFSGRQPSWLSNISEPLTAKAISLFIANMCAGDDAPTGEPTGTYIDFALTHDGGEELRTQIASAIRESRASIADLAGRMVAVYTSIAKNPISKLEGFNLDWFALLAPPGDDPWYDLERDPDVDVTVTTWANRRRYAQGWARKPQIGDAG